MQVDLSPAILSRKVSLAAVLPPGVSYAEISDEVDSQPLHPEEQAAIANAVPKRQKEFARGRTCARRAMTQMGLSPQPLLPMPNRAPAWPLGVAGSITHCSGYTAAAVARRESIHALGIDAEVNEPLPADVFSAIASIDEQALLTLLPDAGVYWDRLLFSAKESIFKAWSPLTGAWLDFLDAEIVIDAATASFQAAIRVHHPFGFLSARGHFTVSPDHLLTAVVLRQ